MKLKKQIGEGSRETIQVFGARENNLKGIDLALDRRQIIAVVGVSGSGKSSLLYQTLAAESEARDALLQTRPHGRDGIRRPTCDRIEGLPFCLTVSQRAVHRNPRSTVATFTGLHDAVRQLVIVHGEIRCDCGALVKRAGPKELLAFLQAKHDGGRVTVGAVVAREPLPSLIQLERSLREARVNVIALQSLPGAMRRERSLTGLGLLDPNQIHSVVVWLGKQRVTEEGWARLSAGVESAFALCRRGVVIKFDAKRGLQIPEIDTGLQAICSRCNRVHRVPDDALLSFNSQPDRSGRCATCEGLGTAEEVPIEALVPDPTLSIEQGCFALRRERGGYKYLGIREDIVRGVCLAHGDTTRKSFGRLRIATREALLQGMGDDRVLPVDSSGRKSGARVRYYGLVPTLRELAADPDEAGNYARAFVVQRACRNCGGTRFRNDALAPYVYRERPFTEILGESVDNSISFFRRCLKGATGQERAYLTGVSGLLDTLTRTGLRYLGIGRSTSTLSGGELQRLKLAASLHRGVSHSCYILDEPSLGLHPSDTRSLVGVIRDLRGSGNTIIVADHDPIFRGAADRVVALGPGAGKAGGLIVSADEAMGDAPRRRRIRLDPKRTLRITGATVNNLVDVDLVLPLGGLVCLTGVSGSGKSSFAHGVLIPAVEAFLASGRTNGPTWKSFDGGGHVSQIARVGQQPIGKSMVSVVATYLDIYDQIRTKFASTQGARARDYSAAHFSYNRPEGRCSACKGRGVVVRGDDPGDALECSQCAGARFDDGVLDVLWRGLSIGDVLRLEASEAVAFFKEEEAIAKPLRVLVELGVGHLQLGRATPTLSGGEAQRVKLAESLAKMNELSDGLVFVLDEPTAGLHRTDVNSLLRAFDRILDRGSNTLVVIEHDMDVIAQADWMIDFGPGAGPDGGHVVYSGPIEGSKKVGISKTGKALKDRGARSKHVTQAMTNGMAGPRGMLHVTSPADQLLQADRFRSALRKLDMSPNDEGEQGLGGIRPTFFVGAMRTTFRADTTPLDSLGLTYRLHSALLPHVQISPADHVHIIRDGAEALMVARAHSRFDIVGFSPLTDLLESGEATRSKAFAVLTACRSRGFVRCVIDGRELPLSAVKFESLEEVDLFSIRVVIGPLPDEDAAASRLLDAALGAGHGWMVVLDQARTGTLRELHLSKRPVFPGDRKIGRRRLTPGVLDRRGDGGCPFCRGHGHLRSFRAELVVADPKASTLRPGFLTSGAEALLRPMMSRLARTLAFLKDESVVDLVYSVPSDRMTMGMLFHGYPWSRFSIPGRSGDKNADFFEWEGLFPILDARLHLSKDKDWLSRLTASRSEECCFACEGTGYGWQMRRATIFGVPVSNLLGSTSLSALSLLASRHLVLPSERLVVDALDDLVRSGLGETLMSTPCRELNDDQRERLRAVAIKYLHFAEAAHGVVVNKSQLEAVQPLLATAAEDSLVVVSDSHPLSKKCLM